MKKILLMTTLFILVFTLTACDDMCVGAECYITAGEGDPDNGVDPGDGPNPYDNALVFSHVSGHGDELDMNAYILLEHEFFEYVRYQVTYLSCTCRAAEVNYWQVAFIEINIETNDIRTISFNSDGGHYIAGMWGDSSPTPAGKTLEDFETDFIPWLVGMSLADLDGISVFTNDQYFDIKNTTNIDEQDMIDSYTNSSVSTNNMIRIAKALLEYHEENY